MELKPVSVFVCLLTSISLCLIFWKIQYDANTQVWEFWQPLQSRCLIYQRQAWQINCKLTGKIQFLYLFWWLTLHPCDSYFFLSVARGPTPGGLSFFQCATHTKSSLTLKETSFPKHDVDTTKLINRIEFWPYYYIIIHLHLKMCQAKLQHNFIFVLISNF